MKYRKDSFCNNLFRMLLVRYGGRVRRDASLIGVLD
jgi:hypothetical protein